MDDFASALIDRLGGTAKVAHLAEAPMSTVHNMRRRLTGSRLNHLRRIAMMEGLGLEVDALAETHGVQLAPLAKTAVALCGRCDVRAEDPRVATCTATDCPMRERSAA